MTIAEIATTGKDQERRSRNDIKTILRASAIPSFNVIARSVLSTPWQSALHVIARSVLSARTSDR